MKRKSIIFLIAATTFLSGFGGVAAWLAGAPAPVESEPAPILIAGNPETVITPDPPPPPDPDPKDDGGQTEGNSWGG